MRSDNPLLSSNNRTTIMLVAYAARQRLLRKEVGRWWMFASDNPKTAAGPSVSRQVGFLIRRGALTEDNRDGKRFAVLTTQGNRWYDEALRHDADAAAGIRRRHRPRNMPDHQVFGAEPTTIRVGDRLTVTHQGIEVGAVVLSVQKSGRVATVNWIQANIKGQAMSGGAGGQMILTGPEGEDWHWWLGRRPDPSANAKGRHRTAQLLSDSSRPMWRAAYVNPIVTTVYVAPTNRKKIDTSDTTFRAAALVFTVEPDGSWTVVRQPHPDEVDQTSTVRAKGHIDDITADLPE